MKASLKTVVLNTCQLACLQKSYTLAHGLFCPQSHDQGNEIGNNHQSYCQHIVMSDVEAQNVTKAKTKQMMQNDTDCKGVFVFVFCGFFFWGGACVCPFTHSYFLYCFKTGFLFRFSCQFHICHIIDLIHWLVLQVFWHVLMAT